MNSLPLIADHLSREAKSRLYDEADAFAQTAFNCYYYASFISTWGLLGQLDRSSSGQPHGKIPGLLQMAFAKRLRNTLKTLQANGLVPKGRAKILQRQAVPAASDMASILQTEY